MSDVMQRQKEARERSLQIQATAQKNKVTMSAAEKRAYYNKLAENNVQLKSGEWISKTDFAKLSEDDQKRIIDLGIRGFNDYYKNQEAEFQANYIQIGDQWISKDTYNNLSDDDKKLINDLGITGFNDYYKKKMEDFKRANVELNTGEWVPRNAFDDLAPDWQSQMILLGTSEFQTWLKHAYPGSNGSFVEINDPYAGKMVFGATDDPNIGIDAAGNRINLYQRWPDATKHFMQGVTISGSVITPIPRTEVSAPATQPAQPVQVVSEEDITPESIDSIEGSVIKLSSGEYIDKTSYDALGTDYQEILRAKGIEALNKEIDKDLTKANEERAAAIQETKTALAAIEAKQSNYADQSLWDKVAQTLNKPVTFSEIVQETLTIGAAQTEAFDSDKIEKEYYDSRLQALEAGQDLGMSLEDYRQQVKAKQITAQELGMQLVPFEYARPGRWDQLQLWEKIVYPALDIVSLVPVAGWAGKGVSALAKGASSGAKIAALGGKAAVQFAAKDAALAVEKAAAQKLVKEGLLEAVKEGARASSDDITRGILQKAVKAAEKDLTVATKEYGQIAKNAEELTKLAGQAEKLSGKGVKVYKASARLEETVGKVARRTEPLDIAGSTGVIGYSTVANWNDLTPEQRAAGLGLAVMTSGIGGKAVSAAENIIDPYKIPIAALKPRAQRGRAQAGKIYNPGKGDLAGTDRLLMDHTIDPENARVTVASVMRQLTEGKDVAKATLKTTAGEREVKVKGTGLQKTVGKTSVSASPMGEIFKEGTGAAGVKTNLEKYLQQANAQHKTSIEITGKPVKIGETELEVKTISAPGVSVKGAEGGMYLGAAFYNQFAHQAAAGGKGKLSAGLLVSTPGITELPKELRNIKNLEKRYEAAIKYFDGSKNVNQEIEGFKRWQANMELENVITNGSQIQRAQNLRSKLADSLHLNRAEYYTRDSKGRIELFQMYMEGGRTTPYTLKELYQLKGNALKNSLEDMFYGLERRIEDLKEGKLVSPKENVITKEEQIAKAFNDIDETVARKGLSDAEAKRLKQEILNEYRARLDTVPSREKLRREVDRLAQRSDAQRRADENQERLFVERTRTETERARAQIIAGRPLRADAARERANDRPEAREGIRARPEEALRSRQQARPEARAAAARGIAREREITRETPREVPRERQAPRETLRETPRPALKNAEKITEYIKANSEEHKNLQADQLRGAVAWKQGLFYQLRWPPFGANDVFYSREPIPEVEYHAGIGSAAKSIVALYGELPEKIRLDMGIVDINISPGKTSSKPALGFKADRKQQTHNVEMIKKAR